MAISSSGSFRKASKLGMPPGTPPGNPPAPEKQQGSTVADSRLKSCCTYTAHDNYISILPGKDAPADCRVSSSCSDMLNLNLLCIAFTLWQGKVWVAPSNYHSVYFYAGRKTNFKAETSTTLSSTTLFQCRSCRRCKSISHPLSTCVLLSGFLYALLSLSDQLLLSFALIFAPVLHDFISLTKGNTCLGKETKRGHLSKQTGNTLQEHFFLKNFSWHDTLGWTSFSNALADSS